MSDCTFKASPFCKTILLPPSINSKDEPVGMGAFLIKYTFKSPPPDMLFLQKHQLLFEKW